jgi:WXG100 family type VII secretion target
LYRDFWGNCSDKKGNGEQKMAGQISVTPEELTQQAQVYLQARDEIEQALQKVGNMNNTIAEEWKGQAFQAYLEQYAQLEGEVKKFEELLASINQQLVKYAQTVAERDAQDAQSFHL